MGMTAPTARAATRALAVLAVLLGLFAMHGQASTHHAAAATTATVAHGASRHPAPPTEPHRAAAPAVEQDAAVLAGPAGPVCDDACPDLTVLCVAVLAGAALLALLLARRAPLRATRPRQDRATRDPHVRHARPPDPVKELCVSRT